MQITQIATATVKRRSDVIHLGSVRSQWLIHSVRPDRWCIFCTPVAVLPTRCNQLDSSVADVEATVEVG